jgi:thioredoxin-related protein
MKITLKTGYPVIPTMVFFALSMVAVTLVGCTTTATWLTDYETARETAALEGKNIFLLISSDAGGTDGAQLRKNVFDTPALLGGLTGNFVPVNLDFSEARFDAAEGSAEETQLMADLDVADKYSVETTPAAYLLTKEGYVIDTVAIDGTVTTGRELLSRVDARKSRVKEFAALLTAAETAAGLDKVRAIDALYEATQGEYRDILADVFRAVPALDPVNITGLVGKYLLQIAFIDAMKDFGAGNNAAGFSKFRTVAADPLLSPEEKQDAWLYLGIFTYQFTNNVADTVSYFRQAIAADPQSEQVPNIEQLIQQLTQASPQQQPAPGRR